MGLVPLHVSVVCFTPDMQNIGQNLLCAIIFTLLEENMIECESSWRTCTRLSMTLSVT